MAKIGPLAPEKIRKNLAVRLGRVADGIRQLATKFGTRPYRCFLVHTRFPGGLRGEGNEVEVSRVEILPTPNVQSLDTIALSPMSAGLVQMGSLRISEISVDRYTEDQLMGRFVPKQENEVPQPFRFFWEVVEDGRGDDPPVRSRFRVMNRPHRQADNAQWSVVLERVSDDRKRDGSSQKEPR